MTKALAYETEVSGCFEAKTVATCLLSTLIILSKIFLSFA